jgi:hypothetical protein
MNQGVTQTDLKEGNTMTGINYKWVRIYRKGVRKPDCFSNVTFTQHNNEICEWYRVHIIGSNDKYGIGDYRLDEIERIEGTLK